MPIQELLKQAEEVRPGDHLVALYREEKEIEEYVVAYIYSALRRQERCIYITGDIDTSHVLEKIKAMEEPDGHKGGLLVLDKKELYSKGGKFSPDRLIAMIKALAEEAVQEGYSGLSVTGEISWVLDYEDGEALIIEYEWKLNESVFNAYPVTALCRYNIDRFSHEMIRNIIQLHPIILWQGRIHENPYYISPEGFKKQEIAKYQVESWLQNIFSYTDTKRRFKTLAEKSQEDLHRIHEEMTSGLMTVFLKLLETHDPYTKDHCTHVADLSYRLAGSLGLSEAYRTRLYYAALVHDIGKTIVPKEILNKSSKLDKEEFAHIKKHPVHGAEALEQMQQLQELALAVRHHHEHFDGGGYPDGLSGEAIPLMSRIISICDSFDAMTHDRPYRKALSFNAAVEEIRIGAGMQFDPGLVQPFLSLVSLDEDRKERGGQRAFQILTQKSPLM